VLSFPKTSISKEEKEYQFIKFGSSLFTLNQSSNDVKVLKKT
jgi:hypothetical protein